MIKSALTFIKNRLVEALARNSNEPHKIVNFINLNTDPPSFTAKINLFLINLEEEKILRPANPYVQVDENGIQNPAWPPLRLNLFILFAAKPIVENKAENGFNYPDAMIQLFGLLKYFQAHPVFTPEAYPDFPSDIQKLVMELNTLTYAQQNEIWSSLKVPYLPSVCYRAKMLIIQEEPAIVEGEIEETQLTVRQS